MESSHNYSMKDKLNANVRLEKRKQIAVNPIKKDNMCRVSRRNGIYIIYMGSCRAIYRAASTSDLVRPRPYFQSG